MSKRYVVVGFLVPLLPLLLWGAWEISVDYPAMDEVTLRLPMPWRRAISESVYERDMRHDPASHAAMQRTVVLDPANGGGWGRRCLWAGSTGDKHEDLRICETAVQAQPSSPLLMSALGERELAAGQACAAEKTYGRAVSLDDNRTHYADLERMARAAVSCGDLSGARVSLEGAIKIEEANRAFSKRVSGDDYDVERRDEEADSKLLKEVNAVALPAPR